MNQWFRVVIEIGPGMGPERATLIDDAVSKVIGETDDQPLVVSPSYMEGDVQYALEYTSDDTLQEEDYRAIVEAVWKANGGPCRVGVLEHSVEESGPDERVFEPDHKWLVV